MKEYCFVRGTEEMKVETDGLGSIDRFMVTGILGTSFSGMVQDGLDLRVGDICTKAKMANFAKTLGCIIRVYDCGNAIVAETANYQNEEWEFKASPAIAETADLSFKFTCDGVAYKGIKVTKADTVYTMKYVQDIEAATETTAWDTTNGWADADFKKIVTASKTSGAVLEFLEDYATKA